MKKFLIVVPACICMHTLLPAQEWHITGNSGTNSSTNFIGTKDNVSFKIRTNNTTRLYIAAAGKIGIGTTSPLAKLDVAGTILGFDSYFGKRFPTSVGTSGASYSSVGYGLTFSDTTATYRYRLNDFSSMLSFNSGGFDFNTAPTGTAGSIIPYTTVMTITQIGSVNIGQSPYNGFPYKLKVVHGGYGLDIEDASTGNDWELHAGGAVGNLSLYFNKDLRAVFDAVTGAYTARSDERLKTNIKPMASMLDKINQLKPCTYQFKNVTNKQEYNGLIAQDVMKIFPSMVTHNVNKERNLDVYTLDYSGFGVLAIKGIQELQPTIEEQKKINEEQQVKITTLEERIVKLEAALASITANNKGSLSNAIINGSLEQNKPNPFTKNTTIHYSIPQGSKGQINIYDKAGRLVKMLDANAAGQLQVNGHDLAAGAYTYTLLVDGKVVSSKQMLIAK